MDKRGLLDLMIARLPKMTHREKITLCESLREEQDLILRSKQDIEAVIGRYIVSWDIDSIRQLAENDAKAIQQRGINLVSWCSPAYPPLLREIYDPPVLLFFKGCLPNPEMPLAAMVGTRKPGSPALAQAYEIARDLARGGISVVSGLALGIDAMAHRGCIDGRAPTVAVLGSGIDMVYPVSNRGLARRILENGGCALSEYPPGTRPFKGNFPARNRIISGLARGVLIVEAPEKSGALITGRFALDQNRDLWVASEGCVVSDVVDRRGTITLAEDGAEVIHSASAILEAWNIVCHSEPDMALNNKTDRASVLARSLGITLGSSASSE